MDFSRIRVFCNCEINRAVVAMDAVEKNTVISEFRGIIISSEVNPEDGDEPAPQEALH